MAEKTTPFVINDRRKFTSEGELRHDADAPSSTENAVSPAADAGGGNEVSRPHGETIQFPSSSATPSNAGGEAQTHPSSEPLSFPGSSEKPEPHVPSDEEQLPPAPSAEQSEQAERAYNATVDRLDTAIRASNPGADRIPEMSLDRFVQSLYMQAILQLGGAAEQGQQPQVDIIGARQTIDMLAILLDKTKGNLSLPESKLLESAVFEARMAFLEITQAIARQAAGRQPGAPMGPGGGPSIVR